MTENKVMSSFIQTPPTGWSKCLFYQHQLKNGQSENVLYEFNVNNIVCEPMKRLSFGGHVVSQKYHIIDTDRKIDVLTDIVLQTPVPMRVPFGKSINKTEGDKEKTTVDLSFWGMEQDPRMVQFYNNIKAWDDFNVETAKLNRCEWFSNDSIHPDVLAHFYKPMSRQRIRRKDKKAFSPQLTLQLKKRYNRYECDVYDSDRNIATTDDITKGCSVIALYRFGGLWFAKNSFSPSNQVLQLQIQEKNRIRGFCITPDETIPAPFARSNASTDNDVVMSMSTV